METLRLALKKATIDDCMLLFSWANDPETRNNSLNPEAILLEAHSRWLSQLLQDESISLYILYLEGVPVGQIRVNCIGVEARISYSIAKEHRGKGLGTEIVRLLEIQLAQDRPSITKLVAEVKSFNIPSRKIFESNGYAIAHKDSSGQIFLYQKFLGCKQ